MPSNVSPNPVCASAVPNTERGSPTKRRIATPSATVPIPDLVARVGCGAKHQPRRKADAECRKDRGAVDEKQRDQHGEDGAAEGGVEPLRHAKDITALPGEQRPERHDDKQRQHQQPNVMSKNGAPTEILSPVSASTNKG